MDPDVLIADAELTIRRMRDDDTDCAYMVVWRNMQHVRRWWDPDLPPHTLESVKEEHGPDTLPNATTTACIIEVQGIPTGFVQFYRWAPYADEASEVGVLFDDLTYGLDIFIGDPSRINKGLGTRIVRLLSDYLIDDRSASAVSLTTALDNHAAQRCYERAGFQKIKEVLDTDTYKGERVASWLMTKEGSYKPVHVRLAEEGPKRGERDGAKDGP